MYNLILNYNQSYFTFLCHKNVYLKAIFFMNLMHLNILVLTRIIVLIFNIYDEVLRVLIVDFTRRENILFNGVIVFNYYSFNYDNSQ